MRNKDDSLSVFHSLVCVFQVCLRCVIKILLSVFHTVICMFQEAAQAAQGRAEEEAKLAQDRLEKEKSICEDLRDRIQEAEQRYLCVLYGTCKYV